MRIRIALAQILYDSQIEKNLESIRAKIEEAKLRTADIVCFPECALSGYGPAHYTSKEEFKPEEIELAVQEVKNLAQNHEINVILGTHRLVDDKWLNSSVLIAGNGRIRGSYDKTHLTSGDNDFYQKGDDVRTFNFAGITVGIQICFDLRFPELFRLLALEGAQVIFMPTYACGPRTRWKISVIEAHVRSRAAENGVFAAIVNSAGPYMNSPSMVVDPDGLIIAQSNLEIEGLLVAEVNLTQPRRMPDFLKLRRTDLFNFERINHKKSSKQ